MMSKHEYENYTIFRLVMENGLIKMALFPNNIFHLRQALCNHKGFPCNFPDILHRRVNLNVTFDKIKYNSKYLVISLMDLLQVGRTYIL